LAQVISSQMASLISSSIDIRLLGYTGISVCRCLLAGVVQYVLMGCQLINCRPLTLQISEVGKTVDVFNAVMLLWRAWRLLGSFISTAFVSFLGDWYKSPCKSVSESVAHWHKLNRRRFLQLKKAIDVFTAADIFEWIVSILWIVIFHISLSLLLFRDNRNVSIKFILFRPIVFEARC